MLGSYCHNVTYLIIGDLMKVINRHSQFYSPIWLDETLRDHSFLFSLFHMLKTIHDGIQNVVGLMT